MSDVRLNDTKFKAALRQVLVQGMNKGGEGLVGHVRTKINKSARVATGKAKRGRKSFRFVASRPGDPPHKRTGTLQKSIAQITEDLGGEIVTRVGTNLRYGFWLELGTKKMGLRPYLRPSLLEYRDRFTRVVNTHVQRFLSGIKP